MARYSASRIKQIIIASLLATLCAFVAVWIAIYLLNITEQFFSHTDSREPTTTGSESKVELLERMQRESTMTDAEKHQKLEETSSTSSVSSESERVQLLDDLKGS